MQQTKDLSKLVTVCDDHKIAKNVLRRGIHQRMLCGQKSDLNKLSLLRQAMKSQAVEQKPVNCQNRFTGSTQTYCTLQLFSALNRNKNVYST